MNYTDVSAGSAEWTLYFTPAGVDLYGNPLYTMQDFATVRLNDSTDATPIFVTAMPWYNPLGDPMDNQIRFRFEMLNQPIPIQQPSDTDQKSLHYIGPI